MRESRPNILWICSDQQRFDALGCYGNHFVDTPNVDRLAEDGVRFERAFCQNPICSPSRASFLTGRYPRTTGVRQNGQSIPERETLVTATLADAGYTCGLAGKLHLSSVLPTDTEVRNRPMGERRIDDGYVEFHWSHDHDPKWPTNQYHHWLRREGVEFSRKPFRDSEYVQTSLPAEHHQTTWCAERAVDFIEANATYEQPWLFSVNPFDPHPPFDPPESYLDRYLERLDSLPLPNHVTGERTDKPIFQRLPRSMRHFPFSEMRPEDHRLVRAAYWAMCDLIDDAVGKMLDALRQTEQLDDTIVLFTSDHGELLGDHGIYMKGPFFYEPAVRVPLVVSGPGIEAGREPDPLVELVDLAPTLLDAAGVEPGPGIQGRSLWPGLTGDESFDGHRNVVYSEYYNEHYQEYYQSYVEEEAHATMIRTDRFKLVNVHGRDEGELYDLQEDPSETHNLWDDDGYSDRRASLLELMTDEMAATVDPLPKRESRV